MGVNGYVGQLKGPFKANENLIDLIIDNATIKIKYIKHLGIQAPMGTIVVINNIETEIGKTGFYEVGNLNTQINSLYFTNPTDENIILDYII